MMRIEEKERDGQTVLQIQGRIAGAFAAELEACWRLALANRQDQPVAIDLSSVTCVDRAGRELLRRMYQEGVPFLRPGIAVQDILDQIIAEQTKEQPQWSQ